MLESSRVRSFVLIGASLCLFLAAAGELPGGTGREAWLRYAPVGQRAKRGYQRLPAVVVRLGDSAVLRSAEQELLRGVAGLTGRPIGSTGKLPEGDAIVLGTVASLEAAMPDLAAP